MNKATARLSKTLGILAGLMGIEHGIGEILARNRPVEGIFILSWPASPFFKIMAGEPALTLIPNYLLTGILAVAFSSLFLWVLPRSGAGGKPAALQLVLLVAMLLSGAGFGPPLVGLIAVLVSFKQNSPLKAWRKLPNRLHRSFSRLWPWSYAICLAAWLMLFPGVALVAFFTGLDGDWLMFASIASAFAMIPLTLFLGYSRDLCAEFTA